jgi:hypothetical protein
MSATPPEVSWPALAGVIADVRRVGADAVADALERAVTGGATSGEILDNLGQVLRAHPDLRADLLPPAQVQWDAVQAAVHGAYPGSALRDWLAALVARFR